MGGLRLIGELAAGEIRRTLDEGHDETGFARFLLHALSIDEAAAIVRAVATDTGLSPRIEICLPRYGFEGVPGIDPEMLTDLSTTELRHAACPRDGRLMVLLDDSQGQSLAQVDKLDADALQAEGLAERWVDAASKSLSLPEEFRIQWIAALKAVLRIDRVSLRQVADYLVDTAEELREGSTITRALGRALPTLRLPRFEALFDEIPTVKRQQPSQWQQRYLAHWRRDCFIGKRDTNQIPFSTSKLREKLDLMADALPEEIHSVLRAYVEAPPGFSEASFAPFLFDWPEVRIFFEEAQRTDAKSLGDETRKFYALEEPQLLTEEERVYLDELADMRGRNPTKNERDEEFFDAHAAELRKEPRLITLWDRFIFGPEVPCTDFVDGLVQCLRRLYHPKATSKRILLVEARERSKAAFLGLNNEACRFFATRYRGLEAALDGLVAFRHVEALHYPDFADEIANHARRAPNSPSKKARQLHFTVTLVEDGQSSSSVRLVWECDLDTVGIGLEKDIHRLCHNKTKSTLVRCTAGYRRARTRGGSTGVSLADLSSLEPASQRDRGSFVPASSRCESLLSDWKQGLASSLSDGLIDAEAVSKLEALFGAFETSYQQALSDLLELGARAPSLSEQAEAFGILLEGIVQNVRAPVALDRLLKPLLEIGAAQVEGPNTVRPVMILCPWHPLRLDAAHGRIVRLRRALERLLAPFPSQFTDGGSLYFGELARALANPGRPEIAVAWPTSKPVVMSMTDALHDYSLHEPPVASTGTLGPTNENAVPTARQIAELVQRYLQLQPHEKDNLSVVLFNCDAAALPQAVVDSIRADAERARNEAMCQVVLRHTSEEQLRDLYQQLVVRELENDSLHSSEATRDFMSRLRISIMVNQQAPAQTVDGPPFDIVFCHDVISRQAMLGWADVPRMTRDASTIDPDQWSRRKPIGRGDKDAVMYLTCPAQPGHGWAYLDAISALIDPELARAARAADRCRIPVRQTDVESVTTRQVLDETHRLGTWVVNFDDLLDRRQLLNNQIKIIRYKHAATGGRSLIISSRASDSLLRATLRSRLARLDLGYDNAMIEQICERLIADANHVSGDIVLRAARRGTNASELIGVVLSKFLVDHELGTTRSAAWIFLDDYASWLGQDEKRIADLLCLAPMIDEQGRPVLDVIVTEAKYVKAAGVNAKAEHSARQLKDTLARLELALLSDDAPADRDIWRARLSDMLLDGLRDRNDETHDWRSMLREGAFTIRVRGYSHVFAYGAGDGLSPLTDAFVGVAGTDTGQQERYGPASVKALVQAYAEKRDPSALRGEHSSSLPTSAKAMPIEASPPADSEEIEPVTPLKNDEVLTEEEGREPGTGSAFHDLLAATGKRLDQSEEDAAWLEDTATRCRNALLRYGMSAKLEQQILTPNAALLKFKGTDDLTVAKVESKLTELETTHGLEVLTVRAEPGRVAISIRRPHRELLTLPQVWRDWRVDHDVANTRLLIGIKEDDGSPLFLQPEPAPHTLVAGSTGSGKSVLVQNILLGIGATNRPDQAHIILIDPKAGVDYFAFETLPHLQGGIIDQPEAALERLEELVNEMERRYALFKAGRVSNIRSYNRAAEISLPVIWLVHDEFADWMQIDSYRAGVEAVVSRLGVKARAAGIYLIFAAQRPDSSVFPMQLRSNLGNRLVLRVDSAGTSDLSLGVKGGGAERLLGKGHLAAILGGGTEPVYAQVPFVGEDELSDLVAALVADLAKMGR